MGSKLPIRLQQVVSFGIPVVVTGSQQSDSEAEHELTVKQAELDLVKEILIQP